ncbi:MAG: GNAT family N-acetyltransferase [Promethearchaeota archaeon]
MFNIRIIKMSLAQINDINKPNEPFLIIGKIISKFDGSDWEYEKRLFEQKYEKKYKNDELDYTKYIVNPDKVMYMAYSNLDCVGQIRMRRNWNDFGFIEDLAVCRSYRRKGVGNGLIQKAIIWAKMNNLNGLMLETQDNNLSACLFYLNRGFKIGAVDTMLYANTENAEEKAIFFYLKF